MSPLSLHCNSLHVSLNNVPVQCSFSFERVKNAASYSQVLLQTLICGVYRIYILYTVFIWGCFKYDFVSHSRLPHTQPLLSVRAIHNRCIPSFIHTQRYFTECAHVPQGFTESKSIQFSSIYIVCRRVAQYNRSLIVLWTTGTSGRRLNALLWSTSTVIVQQ